MRYIYVFCVFLFCIASVFAQSSGAFLGQINNARPSFVVRMDINHPNQVYTKDDLLQATIESSEEGFLYLFYRDAAGNVSMLYPNRFRKRNTIRKEEAVTIPAAESIFQIRIDAPFGNELLKAVVSKEPLAFFGDLDLTGINTLAIEDTDGGALAASLKTLPSRDWAESQVSIRTIDPNVPTPSLKRNIKRPFLRRIILWFKNGRN